MTEDDGQAGTAGAENDGMAAAIAEATEEQPGARAALAAALRSGPAHAYTFVGPSGSGKARAARAFAAELLARGAADPDDARRRALADPSPHPDLTWLRPPGNQHLVEDVRREVIAAVAYRPFEGGRRVFVIEAADAMAEESQNALLKTLEEPPGYAHLILITAEPAALLETVRSRCAAVRFAPLPPESLERRLAAELPEREPAEIAALAALAGGDLGRARRLGSENGSSIRDHAEAAARVALAGELASRPWAGLIEIAEGEGELDGNAVREAAQARADELGEGREASRIKREGDEAAKRAERRGRTEAIDLGLGLVAAWYVDVAAVGEGARDTVRNGDRLDRVSEDAGRTDPVAARRAAELAMDTRRRLAVNVNEGLALDALFHRAAALLRDNGAVV
jgi:DNA polymerase III subunit delta'